jgi:hypothetical protein
MMTDDHLISLVERLVVSQERLATALEGLNETYRRHYDRQYPERRQVRDAVVTRVPTEEDRLREAQGGSATRPLSEWLSEVQDEEEESEYIGVRERDWLSAQGREGDHAEEAG